MDGAIVLDAGTKKIRWANVQLMPDPTILSMETGTRHRTAERVSKQTKALVIAISQRRDVVSIYIEGMKYILQDIPTVLSKANQGLATLEKYRARLDQVAGPADRARVRRRRTPARRALGAAARRARDPDGRRGRALHHRAGHRGPADRDAARGDGRRRDGRARRAGPRLHRRRLRGADRADDRRARGAPAPELLDFGRLAELLGYDRKTNTLDFEVSPRGYRALSRIPRLPRLVAQKVVHRFGDLEAMLAASEAELRRSRGWGTPGRRRSAREFAGFRRSTSSTVIREPDGRAGGRLYVRRRTSQRQLPRKRPRIETRARPRRVRVRGRRQRRLSASRGRGGAEEGDART